MRKQFAKVGKTKVHDIYGVSWDKGENPTLTRTNDAVGAVANIGIDDEVVQNDFDATPFFGGIRNVTDTFGNVFVRIPKVYIRKTDGVDYKTWQVSLTKRPGFYLPWCFWDFINNKELPYFDFGKYNANLDAGGTRLESKTGKAPLISKTILEFRAYATENGAGYQQLDIHAIDLLRTLMFIEFATLDVQTIMLGRTSTSSAANSGACDNVQASSGVAGANDGINPCMYRGIENPFGNVWQWADGVNINDYQAWVCRNASSYASNVFAGSAYEKLSYNNFSASDAWASQMGFDVNNPFAEFCVSNIGGADKKYYADKYYAASGQRVALFGGDWIDGSRAGVSYWALRYSSSTASASLGGRLLKKAL